MANNRLDKDHRSLLMFPLLSLEYDKNKIIFSNIVALKDARYLFDSENNTVFSIVTMIQKIYFKGFKSNFLSWREYHKYNKHNHIFFV